MNSVCRVVLAVTVSTIVSLAHGQLEGSKPDTQPVHHPVPAIQDTETPAQRDARMQWWREARFGMFIHWGLYSIPAGTWDGKQIPGIGEWIMNNASIPVADYKALAPQFNPTSFSAHDIVALAKSAGMKYIVITSKHHDGFAMFKSEANAFNIDDATPFKRDPLQELAAECRKAGNQARVLLLPRPGLDRAWRLRLQDRKSRFADSSLGQGAGRRLRHLSAYQGHSADQGAAEQLWRVPGGDLVRYSDCRT